MEDLYRENILEHYKRPHNWGELEHVDLEAHDLNPLCGDELRVQLAVDEEGRIELTVIGIGVIIGTGIFVLTGEAAGTLAGPAIVFSFVAAGIACFLAALCYAEFASTVPVA